MILGAQKNRTVGCKMPHLKTQVQIRKFIEHKTVIIFLHIKLNMYFGCSKEQSL